MVSRNSHHSPRAKGPDLQRSQGPSDGVSEQVQSHERSDFLRLVHELTGELKKFTRITCRGARVPVRVLPNRSRVTREVSVETGAKSPTTRLRCSLANIGQLCVVTDWLKRETCSKTRARVPQGLELAQA